MIKKLMHLIHSLFLSLLSGGRLMSSLTYSNLSHSFCYIFAFNMKTFRREFSKIGEMEGVLGWHCAITKNNVQGYVASGGLVGTCYIKIVSVILRILRKVSKFGNVLLPVLSLKEDE